jgi:hypothetical protein
MGRFRLESNGRVIVERDVGRAKPVVITLDYERGDNKLLHFDPVHDGFIVDYALSVAGDHYRIVEKRTSDGDDVWTFSPYRDDTVRIDETLESFSLNGGPWIRCVGRIRYVKTLKDAILVRVEPDDLTGGRNLFMYDRAGNYRWQVGVRTHRPDLPYFGVSLVDGKIEADGSGFCARIDPADGNVLDVRLGKW